MSPVPPVTVCDKGKKHEDDQDGPPRPDQRLLGLGHGWRLEERLSLKKLAFQLLPKGSGFRPGALLLCGSPFFSTPYKAHCMNTTRPVFLPARRCESSASDSTIRANLRRKTLRRAASAPIFPVSDKVSVPVRNRGLGGSKHPVDTRRRGGRISPWPPQPRAILPAI